ncbi:hypothetical protein Aab01nite_33500 [Paractinoplanes abujensis]|uniref:Putative ATPase n=1 Tax=Paractinoplanes abujensis TaxID=882441 RepID=A0A7W7CZV8_9ACTN|nr:hypothetical protein [Actinoplanes abujensis]MBB4697754.1 putative ATPase [Actinoplanes abujensis]GID19760.1 hypothetical protein Aab01nite_33500 [Actinoplanes abujensis]
MAGRAHVLTGTPGSGKTALLRRLEVAGHAVVEVPAAPLEERAALVLLAAR